MKFVELAEKRSSIRGFTSDPVTDEILNEIIHAGILAPTAKNLQPFHFIVVRNEEKLDQLSEGYPAPFFRQAPVVIVICTDEAQGWTRDRFDGKNYSEIDAAIATDHMTLAAADNGLGTCWIGAFNPEIITAALGLPEGVAPIAMLPIGYPSEDGRPKTRKSLNEIVRYDHW